jgi:hypothetical protein
MFLNLICLLKTCISLKYGKYGDVYVTEMHAFLILPLIQCLPLPLDMCGPLLKNATTEDVHDACSALTWTLRILLFDMLTL